jgi:hypothetical protein
MAARVRRWLDALVRDGRAGGRLLRRDSAVSAAAIASLSLALGASIAAFALVNALIRPRRTSIRDRRRRRADVQRRRAGPGDGRVAALRDQTMRIPIVAGRAFEASDLADPRSRAVVVNDAFARAYFGGMPAVGQTLRKRIFDDEEFTNYEIVGVAADTRYDLRKSPAPIIYVRLSPRGNVTLQVRAGGDPAAIAPRLVEEIRGAGPSFRVTSVTTEAASIARTLLRERLLALLAGFFGIVGLALAAVGLFGVLSYSVAQRTREIGIRSALGARPFHAVRTVVADTGGAVLAGAAAGLACGVYLSRFVAALLYEVRPLAVGSLAWPLGVLLLTAAAAAMLPVCRAVRLDPAAALRED